MGLLVRAGPDKWEGDLPILAVVVNVVSGPSLDQQVLSLLQVVPACLHGGAEALVLEDVVAGAPTQANNQAAPADVVDEGGLDGEADRVVQLQLNDAESKLHSLSLGGYCAPEHQWVGIGRLAAKVVLRQPDGIPTQLLDHLSLIQAIVYQPEVLSRVEADGKKEVTEAHCPPRTGMLANLAA